MRKYLTSSNLMVAVALIAVAFAAQIGVLHITNADSMALIAIGATQLTPAQARVVDPVLTTIAQGYKNADFVGMSLFPSVPVQVRGGKILTFGKEDFAIYASARAPGANTKRIQVGYTSGSFALTDYSLEGTVPFELQQEASAVPGLDLGRASVMKVQNSIGLQLEKAQADLAILASGYASTHKNTALSGTTLWSDLTNSDPIGDVEAGKEAIRADTGRRPNTMVIGPKVLKALRQHSKILDRIKYTGRDVPTPELLASLFGVSRVLVGDAIYTDAAGAFVDVWGKNVVLAYTELASVADMGAPSYGYTYRLGGYPLVEVPYQDRNAKSWVYPVTDSNAPVIAGATAGYLIQPAVA